MPAVGPGAVLVRCDNDTTGHALVLPDERRPGVRFLQADTRSNAVHPASYAPTSLVEAVADVYS